MTKSPTGTTSVEAKVTRKKSPSLEVDEICRIIRVSGLARVSTLKWGTLELTFHGSRKERPDEDESSLSAEMETERPKAEEPRAVTPSHEIPVDEKLLEELTKEQLLLDSPEAFESAQIDALLRPETLNG